MTLNDKFVSGAIIDEGGDKSRFICGQMISETNGEDATFIPGEMGLVDSRETFVPGQRVENGVFRPGQMAAGTFLHGEIIVTAKGQPQFLPGIYEEETENGQFCPGVVFSGGKKEGLFIEGKLLNVKENNTLFVPGTTLHTDNGDNRFEKCQSVSDAVKAAKKSPSPPPLALETEGLALIHKKIKPKNGTMVVWENGSQFYAEGSEIPSDLEGSAEFISGRMECTENGPLFVAGKVMVSLYNHPFSKLFKTNLSCVGNSRYQNFYSWKNDYGRRKATDGFRTRQNGIRWQKRSQVLARASHRV